MFCSFEHNTPAAKIKTRNEKFFAFFFSPRLTPSPDPAQMKTLICKGVGYDVHPAKIQHYLIIFLHKI